MEEFVYAFLKEEGIVFEVITNEGDNLYWADNNGGIRLNAYDVNEILNNGNAAEILNNIWKKLYHHI